jgi:hypothetical protein
MEPRDLIRKLTPHKKDPAISKLIIILELCEMNRLPLDYIEDLLTFEETRLLSVITRSILKDKGVYMEKMDKPIDELMGLFSLLVV